MPKTRRRTRRTDSNGALKETYRDSWERNLLDTALRAGVPEKMLDPAGSDDWRDTGSVLGLWSEFVYTLSDCLRGADPLGNERRDNVEIVEDVFGWMCSIARGLGIDPNLEGLIPWDVWTWRRGFSPLAVAEGPTAEEAQAELDARTAAADDYDAVTGAWGAPSGPEHDSHGHGFANGHWRCNAE
jgi:hypothetical protein